MRKLLRQREIVTDEWRYLGEEGAEGADALIVPIAQLAETVAVRSTGRLGVRIGATARLDEIAPHLPRLALVAIEFPAPGDGRGYSLARVLRDRYHFTGEVRAVGAVKLDQIFFMSRSGFDSFDLAPGEDFEAARRALDLYSVAYQPRGALQRPGADRA